MSGLLPHVIRHAVTSRSVFGASQSFGIVTLTLLVVVLLEHEMLRLTGIARARATCLSVVSVPLLIAVALTIGARLQLLLR